MDAGKVALGALLLFVSSVVSMEIGSLGTRLPLLVAAVASLVAAAGTLLVGTLRRERVS